MTGKSEKRGELRARIEAELQEEELGLQRLEEMKSDVEGAIAQLQASKKAALADVPVGALDRVAAAKAKAETEIRKNEIVLEELDRRIAIVNARVSELDRKLKRTMAKDNEERADELALEAAKLLEKSYVILKEKGDIVSETSRTLGITPQSFFTANFADRIRNALYFFFREYAARYPESDVKPSVDLNPRR